MRAIADKTANNTAPASGPERPRGIRRLLVCVARRERRASVFLLDVCWRSELKMRVTTCSPSCLPLERGSFVWPCPALSAGRWVSGVDRGVSIELGSRFVGGGDVEALRDLLAECCQAPSVGLALLVALAAVGNEAEPLQPREEL